MLGNNGKSSEWKKNAKNALGTLNDLDSDTGEFVVRRSQFGLESVFSDSEINQWYKLANAFSNDDNLLEYKKKLEDIYNYTKKIGQEKFGDKYDQNSSINNTLTTISNKIAEINTEYDKSKDSFNTYTEGLIQYDSKYSGVYANMLATKQKYQKALADGDNTTADKEYAAMVKFQQEFANMGSDNEAINLFMDNFFDTFNASAGRNKLRVNIEANTDGIETQTKNALNKLKGLTSEQILQLDVGTGTAEQQNGYKTLTSLAEKYGISIEDLINDLITLGYVEQSQADSNAISVSSLKEINDSLDTIQSNFKTVQDIIKGYNSETGLSIDNLQTLLSMGDDYINYLVDENGNLNLNTEAYYNLADAQLQQMKLRIVEDGLEVVNNLKTKADAVNYLTEATKLSTEATNDDIESKIRAAYANTAEQDAKLGTTAFTDVLDKQVEVIAKRLSLVDANSASLKKNTAAALGSADANKTLTNSLNDQKDALEAQQKALEDSQSDMEDAKSSISDLISLTTDMIKQQKEDEKEALENAKQAELDALEETQARIQDKIDKQKELLDQEKEAYEFQKSLEEKQNSYVSNRLKEVATSFDDSSSGKAQNKKDKDTSTSSKKDLQEFLYEHTLDLRQDALDKMLEQENTYYDKQKESVENSYSKQVDAIDKFLSDEVAMYKAACNKIDKDNGTLYKQLKAYVSKYTTQTEAEFNRLWKSAQDAIARYRGDNVSLIDVMNDLQAKLYNVEDNIKAIKNRIDGVSQAISNTSSSISSTTAAVNNSTKAVNNYADALKNLKEQKDKVSQAGTPESSDLGMYPAAYGSANSSIKNPKSFTVVMGEGGMPTFIPQYATGTKSAKGGVTKVDEEGLYSELIPYQTGTGRYTILPEGNPVFSKAMTDNLWELSQMSVSDYANNIKKNIGDVGSSLSYVQNSSSISPTIVLQISGDATSATVTALKQQQGEIVNQVMKQTLKLMKMK